MKKNLMRFLAICSALVLGGLTSAQAEDAKPEAKKGPSLVEKLGYPKDAKVLILNGDDFGMNHSDTVATIKGLKSGGLTDATIMVPCPWFMEVVKFAEKNPQANLGIHLTLTSEWRVYKWGPVVGWAGAPSLCDELGYMYPDIQPVYLHAKIDEVEKEVRAQIDRAIKAGIDVTHIDSHMGTLQYNKTYHEMYLKVAKDYKLPCRMAGINLMAPLGGKYLLDMADDMGVIHPDWLYNDGPKNPEKTEEFWLKRLDEIQAGMVSEIFIHCGELTPEMEATTGSFRQRTADAVFFSSPQWLEAIKQHGIKLTSYRHLRELMRTGKAPEQRDFYGWEDKEETKKK